MYKQGDILVNKNGEERKVLGVCGDVYFMSFENEFESASDTIWIKRDLDNAGYTLKQQPWKPKEEEEYWFIANDGIIHSYKRVQGVKDWDEDRLQFGNIFPTKEKAEEARDKVKALLLSLRGE